MADVENLGPTHQDTQVLLVTWQNLESPSSAAAPRRSPRTPHWPNRAKAQEPRPAHPFATVHDMAAQKRHDRLSDNPSGELRRYIGVFFIFCGVAPLLMFSGLATKIGEPDFPALPVFVAAPFIVAGVAVTVLGIAAKDPKRSAQRVGAGAALIILGDLLIFGIRTALV